MKILFKDFGIHHVFIIIFLCIAAYYSTDFPLQTLYAAISSIAILLFALPSYLGLWKTYGFRISAILIVSMSVFAIVLENIAVYTGIPYGKFSYGNMMGYTIGFVPWTVGFAWTPILFGAFTISYYLYQKAHIVMRIITTAIIMTLFDIVLDPGSVSLGYWNWNNSQGFYGVPWSNYIGWLITSSIAALFLIGILKYFNVYNRIPTKRTMSSYMLMTIYWIAVAFFQELHGVYILGLGIVLFLVASINIKEQQ